MARKAEKPKMIVNSFYLNEMSAEQAFADFYFEYFKYAKSSADTNDTDDFDYYTDGKDEKGVAAYVS